MDFIEHLPSFLLAGTAGGRAPREYKQVFSLRVRFQGGMVLWSRTTAVSVGDPRDPSATGSIRQFQQIARIIIAQNVVDGGVVRMVGVVKLVAHMEDANVPTISSPRFKHGSGEVVVQHKEERIVHEFDLTGFLKGLNSNRPVEVPQEFTEDEIRFEDDVQSRLGAEYV